MANFYKKLFQDLNEDIFNQMRGKYFICLHSPHYSGDIIGYQPYFEYLVIFEKEFICRFKELDKAKEYVELMNNLQ